MINRILKFSFFLILTFSIISNAQEQILSILPQPQDIKFTNTHFNLSVKNIGVFNYLENYEQIKIALDELTSISEKYRNVELTNKVKQSQNIYIGIASESNDFIKILQKNDIEISEKIGEEGYQLFIDSEKIIISANHQEGIFYGLQSLKQLLRGNVEKNTLPGLKIIDWPIYKYRAVSDDISRGPLPNMWFMKYQIRRFAELKINTVIHYVEHVVKTKSHPEFAPVNGSLTIEEWKEISDYANKYNITIIGGFQSFGHFKNILSAPELSHLGESGSLLSPVLPESYEFLEDIYSEMIPAFSSPIFNVNCDETFDLGKEASKALVDSIGYDGVYFQHMMKLYNILKKHDLKMLMWGDILLQYPKLLKQLPKDILIGSWAYSDLENFDKYCLPFLNNGFEYWVVPGVLNSHRILPNFNTSLANINGFSKDGVKYGASGLLNTVWDDNGTGLFSNDWYGVAYGAEKSWNINSKNYDKRFNTALYSASDNSYSLTINKINELAILEPTDNMTDKIFFLKILPEENQSLRISVKDWEDVLRIIKEAETLLKNTSLHNYSEDKQYLQFIIDLYKALALERFDIIEAVKNYKLAESFSLNDIQISRKYIINTIDIINNIIERQTKLKNVYEKIWLIENHTYALSEITDKFEIKINDFMDVKNRLFNSLNRIDSELSISPLEEVRLNISELPGKYFREWMMINPINNVNKEELSKNDFLIDMGGESTANPKVTQEFYYDSIKYRWRRVVSEYPDIVNLSKIFNDDNQNVIMYAFANISLDENKIVKASVGSSSGIEVFINGTSVFSKISNKLKTDEFTFNLPLIKGKNNLLIKISHLKGDWGFTFRLPDSDVRNSKNRYKILK